MCTLSVGSSNALQAASQTVGCIQGKLCWEELGGYWGNRREYIYGSMCICFALQGSTERQYL